MDVFAALADPVRRDLVLQLAGGSSTVNELAAIHPISRPAVSRHLRLLREAGVVTADQDGRRRVHRLDRSALAPVRALLEAIDQRSVPVPEHLLDGLELEVRRTVRDQRRGDVSPSTIEEDAR
jgi:DNA-binding transcriptional ArsR family regulator